MIHALPSEDQLRQEITLNILFRNCVLKYTIAFRLASVRFGNVHAEPAGTPLDAQVKNYVARLAMTG
jgi:hypothetical protein